MPLQGLQRFADLSELLASALVLRQLGHGLGQACRRSGPFFFPLI